MNWIDRRPSPFAVRVSSSLPRAITLLLLLAAPTFFTFGERRPERVQVKVPLDQPQPLPGPRPSKATIEAWKARKFGMFIHFGLYSTLGGKWQGKEIDNGLSEQIMANAPIPLDQYAALAKDFNPSRFDPDAIVALAKAAGMKFIVITTKHHDGFNMFHTAQTRYNIVDGTPYGKDAVRMMQEACARASMKFGVYYSTIDWHLPGGSTYIEGNSNPVSASHEAFNVAQLKELLSKYGPISEIWFDMGKPTAAQSERFTQTVHDLQPQTMVSGRVFNYQGDFTVMGDNQVPEFVIDEPWQTPASIFADTWGYRSWEKRENLEGKIEENILRLAQVVSRGGNFILNIGPEGDGSVVPYEAEVLQGLGKWVAVNGEAIYGSGPQPFRKLDFGYATVGKGKLYLFVRDAPKDGKLRLPMLTTSLRAAFLLGDSKKIPLAVERDAEGVYVAAPSFTDRVQGPAGFLPVIVASFDGPLQVTPQMIAPNSDGNFALDANQADHFFNYNGYGYEAPSTLYKLRWTVAAKPGKYNVQIGYKSMAAAHVDLVVNGKILSIVLPATKTGGTLSREISLDMAEFTVFEITPPEPFYKGTQLGAEILSVELVARSK